jgi:hypothetical protein
MGGTSEAHAAIDADLPPGFASALESVYAWSPPTNDSLGPARLVSEDYQSSPRRGDGGTLPGPSAGSRHTIMESLGWRCAVTGRCRASPGTGPPARADQGLPATVMRPRAIAPLAIAVHADRVDAPFGRFSVVLRAYTVNR